MVRKPSELTHNRAGHEFAVYAEIAKMQCFLRLLLLTSFRNLIGLVFFTASQLMSASISHADERRTFIGHNFDECLTQPGRQLFLWAPAVYTWCQWGANGVFDREVATAIRNCNAKIPKAFRRHVSCILAYDGERIVDARLNQYLERMQPVPVKIEIYDAISGQLQISQGTLHTEPYFFGNPIDFRLLAKGVELCRGNAISISAQKITFDATCFGENFSGKANLGTLVKFGSVFQAEINPTTLRSEGSWIKLFF